MRALRESRHGFRLYRPIQFLIGLNSRQAPVTFALGGSARGLKVIGSSEQVHEVDALAITGDEGRSSLR